MTVVEQFNLPDHKGWHFKIGEHIEGELMWMSSSNPDVLNGDHEPGYSVWSDEHSFFESGISTFDGAVQRFRELLLPFAMEDAMKKAHAYGEDWKRRTRVTYEMMQRPINRF